MTPKISSILSSGPSGMERRFMINSYDILRMRSAAI